MNAAAVARIQHDRPDGHYVTTLDAFGGSWNITVGYRVISYGTAATTRMTSDGIQRDAGEAPTVKALSVQVGNPDHAINLPIDLLSGDQIAQLESEVSSFVEDLQS